MPVRSSNIEDCFQISIKSLGRACSKQGYTLGQIVSLLRDPSYKGEIFGTMSWKWEDRFGNPIQNANISFSFGSDSDGVFIELSYLLKYDFETEYREERYRYYLEEKESNLIPGSYRYYFRDPYSDSEPGLCTKLYLYKGIFYPRSRLLSSGVLYKQQREGHTQRYVWTYYHRVPPETSLKYRKSHYRGKETPYWSRYNHLCEEADKRVLLYLISKHAEEYADLIGESRL